MRLEYQDSSGKQYVYNESPWTGKKELAVNGVPAQKLSKKDFILPDNVNGTLKGNFLTGLTLLLGNGEQIVLCKNMWYDWLLIFLPFLNFGLGIFCGAIGGGLSGLFGALAAYFNASVLRTKQNIFVKIFLCLVIFAASFFAWFMIYAMIVGGIAAAFPSIFS